MGCGGGPFSSKLRKNKSGKQQASKAPSSATPSAPSAPAAGTRGAGAGAGAGASAGAGAGAGAGMHAPKPPPSRPSVQPSAEADRVVVTVAQARNLPVPDSPNTRVSIQVFTPRHRHARSDLLSLLGDRFGGITPAASAGAEMAAVSVEERARVSAAALHSLHEGWTGSMSGGTPSVTSSSDGSARWGHSTELLVNHGDVLVLSVLHSDEASPSASSYSDAGSVLLLPEWFLQEPRRGGRSGITFAHTGYASTAGVMEDGWLPLSTATDAAGGQLQLGVDVQIAEQGSKLTESLQRSTESSSKPSAATPGAATPSVRLAVKPHKHTKYCDRVREVCTADGRFREGNCLYVDLSAVPCPPGKKPVIRWYMWNREHEEGEEGGAGEGAGASGDAGGDADGDTAVEARAEEEEEEKKEGEGEDAAEDASDVAVTPAPRPAAPPTSPAVTPPSHSCIVLDGVTLRLFDTASRTSIPGLPRIPALPVSHLLHDDSLAAAAAVTNEDSSLYSSESALLQDLTAAHESATRGSSLFLTSTDVGCRFACVVEHPNGNTYTSPLTIAIEAAPPKAREVWVTGDVSVGSLLTAHVYYFGGSQGETQYTWIQVHEDGSRSERGPTGVDPHSALPAGDDAASDPRCRLLTAADVGCIFKVTATPVRSDGLVGAPSTSKISKAVKP